MTEDDEYDELERRWRKPTKRLWLFNWQAAMGTALFGVAIFMRNQIWRSDHVIVAIIGAALFGLLAGFMEPITGWFRGLHRAKDLKSPPDRPLWP